MTFKELSFKKKLEHIWEYYKWFIIGMIVVVVAGSSLCYHMFIKQRPVNFAGVAFYNINLTEEQYNGVKDEMNEALSLTYPDTIQITDYYFIDGDVIFNDEMNQRFSMQLFSKELQVFVSYSDNFDEALSDGFIADLTKYYSSAELEALKAQDRLLYLKDETDGTEKPYGIKINSSAIFKKCGMYTNEEQPAYAALIPVKDYTDNAKAALDAIIKE
jgi:hypothetical protein